MTRPNPMTLTVSVSTNHNYADGPIRVTITEVTDATPDAIAELFSKLALDVQDRVGVQVFNWRQKLGAPDAVQLDA